MTTKTIAIWAGPCDFVPGLAGRLKRIIVSLPAAGGSGDVIVAIGPGNTGSLLPPGQVINGTPTITQDVIIRQNINGGGTNIEPHVFTFEVDVPIQLQTCLHIDHTLGTNLVFEVS